MVKVRVSKASIVLDCNFCKIIMLCSRVMASFVSFEQLKASVGDFRFLCDIENTHTCTVNPICATYWLRLY